MAYFESIFFANMGGGAGQNYLQGLLELLPSFVAAAPLKLCGSGQTTYESLYNYTSYPGGRNAASEF